MVSIDKPRLKPRGRASHLAKDCAPAINSLESRPPSNIPPFFCMHVSDFLHDMTQTLPLNGSL
jgi:hypothetical protein